MITWEGRTNRCLQLKSRLVCELHRSINPAPGNGTQPLGLNSGFARNRPGVRRGGVSARTRSPNRPHMAAGIDDEGRTASRKLSGMEGLGLRPATAED